MQVTIGRNVFSTCTSKTGGCLWNERRYKKWIYSRDFRKPLERRPWDSWRLLGKLGLRAKREEQEGSDGQEATFTQGECRARVCSCKGATLWLGEAGGSTSMALKHWKQYSKNLAWDFHAPDESWVHNGITVAFLATRYESSRETILDFSALSISLVEEFLGLLESGAEMQVLTTQICSSRSERKSRKQHWQHNWCWALAAGWVPLVSAVEIWCL